VRELRVRQGPAPLRVLEDPGVGEETVHGGAREGVLVLWMRRGARRESRRKRERVEGSRHRSNKEKNHKTRSVQPHTIHLPFFRFLFFFLSPLCAHQRCLDEGLGLVRHGEEELGLAAQDRVVLWGGI
jgi:hypothetical protein